MEIPKSVLDEARTLVKQYGPRFSYLGESGGWDYYLYNFPEDVKTGYPFVYLYQEGHPAFEVTGSEALDIIASFGAE
jgi:hypothetical protein